MEKNSDIKRKVFDIHLRLPNTCFFFVFLHCLGYDSSLVLTVTA